MLPVIQSARPHGARPGRTEELKKCIWFQSTRPHGARPIEPCLAADEHLFQSTRPHGARRTANKKTIHIRVVSIHAPARGATLVRKTS